jgi:predicted acyltransferase
MRYRSIDFFRGMTIAFMLIVNEPGTWDKVFGPLLHAEWHGCTPTDLVFPSFLFIIGVSMWFSFEKYGRAPNSEAIGKILRRTAMLFFIGLLLAWFPFWGKSFTELRIMGVLQRLGLCYGIAALLVLYCSQRVLIAVAVGILVGYWGLHIWWGDLSVAGNLPRQVDLAVLGANHLWGGKGIPFDPEGLLSTLPAAVNVLFGWWSGQIIQRYQLDKMRVVGTLLLWGNILALSGVLWDWAFPENKSLWTSSFVLHTSGISMILLAFSAWAIDVRQWQGVGFKFFEVFGANSLFAYILAALLVKCMFFVKWLDNGEPTNVYEWIYRHVFYPINDGKLGSFLFALAFMGLCWVVCWAMYRKKIFVKI